MWAAPDSCRICFMSKYGLGLHLHTIRMVSRPHTHTLRLTQVRPAGSACLAVDATLLPMPPAVPSPSEVTYRCPQKDSTWTSSNFTLTLVVSAGETGCGGQGRATATVVIDPAPGVTITGPPARAICSTDIITEVNVTFSVETADSNTVINAPDYIINSAGGNCTMRDDARSEYYRGQAVNVVRG